MTFCSFVSSINWKNKKLKAWQRDRQASVRQGLFPPSLLKTFRLQHRENEDARMELWLQLVLLRARPGPYLVSSGFC